jgi:hypothetical protein
MTEEEIVEEANRRAVVDLTNQGRLGIASVIAAGQAEDHPLVVQYRDEVEKGVPFAIAETQTDMVHDTPFVVDVGTTPEVVPAIQPLK